MPLTSHNILLLQGPMGPFFWWFARRLRKRGATVYKVNLNGGDALFYPTGAIPYRGSYDDWPAFFESLVRSRKIDEIVLFGDCRAYHRAAISMARRMGLAIRVFEEGYLRPHWITLEEDGVNGNSTLPSEPSFFWGQGTEVKEEATTQFSHPFSRMVFFTLMYGLVGWLSKWKYPGYRHHRGNNIWQETRQWLLSAWRRYRHAPASRKVTRLVAGPLNMKYFLFPLQVHNDCQLLFHSPKQDQSKILYEVIGSFAHHAPENLSLVIKHHPMDRAYRDYTSSIREFARHYGVSGRVIYTWDAHLPTLLRHARGVVTVNSTVGLQALFHNVPVKVLGRAIYKIKGLTDFGPLENFWTHPMPPDPDLYQKFRGYLLDTNQFNGSFSYPPTRQLLDHWVKLDTRNIPERIEETGVPWLEVA